jgi:predicted DNA-binding transcriptional regulator YafY
MQSQRLISCLLLLQGERRQTARRLAEALEVSTRTVYRDVEALSAAGVPVHMERGPRGGIVLSDEYRRALAQFTAEELQALFAIAADPLADLGTPVHALALRKLAGALPDAQRKAAERGRDTLLLDPNRWYRGEQPTEILALLRRAVAEERRVRIRYRDRGGAGTERVVEPLGLVAKAGIWYLIARNADGAMRTFRAQRILEAAATTERFRRPPDFDLAAHWRSSVAAMERQPVETYDAVLRVPTAKLERVTPYWDCEPVAEEPGHSVLRVRFPAKDVAVAIPLSLGDDVEIVAPQELRDAVVACAEAALRRYAGAARVPARSFG